MPYKKMLKRKVYPTWIRTKKLNGCKVYIKQTPNEEFYFFEVVCDQIKHYSSLQSHDESKIRFIDFDTAVIEAEAWIKENIVY